MKFVHSACLAALLSLSVTSASAQVDPIDPVDPTVNDEQMDDQGLDDLFSDDQAEEMPQASQQRTYNKRQTATLRALDKITGRSTDFEIKVGEPVVYGSLKIDLEVCFQTPPEEPPESAAFLQVETVTAVRMNSMAVPRLAKDVEGVDASGVDAAALVARGEDARRDGEQPDQELLFSGWMFSSSPGLSALEHPVYDVWVIRCTERSPVSRSAPGSPEQ